MDAPRSRSWSIHGRPEITSRYEILDRVGSGTYADVYKARRISDGLFVALKEIHDYQNSYREIESLQILHNSPNIITLHDYFWAEDEDAVLVLEFLPTDLSSVIREAKKNWESGISLGEVKRWMVQILQGLEVCHRNSIVHRDLKPSNLLISAEGVLKLADFGQGHLQDLDCWLHLHSKEMNAGCRLHLRSKEMNAGYRLHLHSKEMNLGCTVSAMRHTENPFPQATSISNVGSGSFNPKSCVSGKFRSKLNDGSMRSIIGPLTDTV